MSATPSNHPSKKAWPYPRWFAHRGGGKQAPENTLAALREGLRAGYRAVEFDVKLSADGVAILMHDPVAGRTTSGQGAFAAMRYDAIRQLDAGSWHSPSFAGEPVPRFTDVAQWLIEHNMLANVEIKPCPGREVETGLLVGGLCRDLWLDSEYSPLISSFSAEALRAAARAAPGLPLGWLVEDPGRDDLSLLDELSCVSLHCHHPHVTPALVADCHARGLRLLTYTVNDPARARTLLEWDVDGLFTDALDVMRAAFPQDF